MNKEPILFKTPKLEKYYQKILYNLVNYTWVSVKINQVFSILWLEIIFKIIRIIIKNEKPVVRVKFSKKV